MNLDARARTFQQLFWIVGGAVALTCAFPAIHMGFCAWFALALLLIALRESSAKEAFFLGLLAGFIHFLTLLYWLVPTMHNYGPLPMWMSIGLLLLLAFYLALYVALFAMFTVAFSRRPAWLLLTVPVLWVSFEYLRGYLFSGFPWGLIGYSQYRFLHLIQISDIFGVYGVSFFLGLINASLFLALMFISRARWNGHQVKIGLAGAALAAALVVIVLTAGYGKFRIDRIESAINASDTLKVSVIQGNIEQSLKWDEQYSAATTRKYIRLSEEVAEGEPDLVVWPETALPFYFHYDGPMTDEVLNAVAGMNTWFLVGSPSFNYDPHIDQVWLYNTAFLIDPDGREAGKYDKVHLVPFGEYVPLKKWLPFVGKMVPQISDFKSGLPGHLLSDGKAALGVQICYEIIFPDLSAEMVWRGGDLIVNITNDAWFGKTAAPRQHFSMALFRAVENRRTLVRAANTGISAFVDPAGRVVEETGLFETAAITRDIPVMRGEKTVYTLYGNVLPALCLLGLLLITAVAAAKKVLGREGH